MNIGTTVTLVVWEYDSCPSIASGHENCFRAKMHQVPSSWFEWLEDMAPVYMRYVISFDAHGHETYE